jgi:hypothetical protein
MSSSSSPNAKSPKMGKAFRRIRAAMVGDLYQRNLFPQWIRRNGGEFYDKVTDKVTHLIASEQAYEENVEEGKRSDACHSPSLSLSCGDDGLQVGYLLEIVQAAKALGKIKIVSRDWLTASLHANPIRPVPERPFLLENLVKPPKKTAEGKNGADGKADSGLTTRTRFSMLTHPLLNLRSREVLICILNVEDPFVQKRAANGSKSITLRTFACSHRGR